MAIPLLWLGLNQLSTGSSQYEYSLLTINARLSYNIARFEKSDSFCHPKNEDGLL